MENRFSPIKAPHCCTSLQPGATVTLVPYGVLITIQYSSEGNIEKIYTGVYPSGQDVTPKLMNRFIDNAVAPTRINITGGTTWVVGVIVPQGIIFQEGTVSTDIVNGMVDADPSTYQFYAAYIESNAIAFHNIQSINHVLSTHGFKTLPMWVVPFAGVSQAIMDSWFSADTWIFSTKVVMNYVSWMNGEKSWYTTGLHQLEVDKVQVDTDAATGIVHATLYNTSGEHIAVSMYDIYKYQIQKGSMVLLDAIGTVLLSVPTGKHKQSHVSDTITCAYCGKQYKVQPGIETICPDTHCTSRLVERIKLMLNMFNLPINYSDNEWSEKIASKHLMCLTDVFTLPVFEHMEITTTLANILRALIPISLIRSNDVFEEFANRCNNNVTTFQYYVTNFDRAEFDLNFHHIDAPKLGCWLSEPANASDVAAVLMLPNLTVTGTGRSYNGAPIFRNKRFFITGGFKRGAINEIADFLRSYSAEVYTEWNDKINAVVVGSTRTNIDGQAIYKARMKEIDIFDEDEFFTWCDLDSDLANLQ